MLKKINKLLKLKKFVVLFNDVVRLIFTKYPNLSKEKLKLIIDE
ncbi:MULTISPECIES: hypothetical protein [Borreliella]|uniref:Protein p23 n=1 Tax=Borreliella valaisiana VS116 TaxID=445987 RepID=C0R8M9_BORVA|nr:MULTISPECIES: hypothetical protein [Borreliella]ACN52787.1 protein p23 [Borreliella valaisiana VS116]